MPVDFAVRRLRLAQARDDVKASGPAVKITMANELTEVSVCLYTTIVDFPYACPRRGITRRTMLRGIVAFEARRDLQRNKYRAVHLHNRPAAAACVLHCEKYCSVRTQNSRSAIAMRPNIYSVDGAPNQRTNSQKKHHRDIHTMIAVHQIDKCFAKRHRRRRVIRWGQILIGRDFWPLVCRWSDHVLQSGQRASARRSARASCRSIAAVPPSRAPPSLLKTLRATSSNKAT